jgi:hypothetical protein
LGVSTCLPSVPGRDGAWVSSTERFVYVSRQVDDGLLLLVLSPHFVGVYDPEPKPPELRHGVACVPI